MKKRAFTLIELLVVISIIAVLMSILMPALGKVRQQAVGLVCRTQFKDVGTTVRLYMQDNDSKMVANYYEPMANGTGRWTVRLAAYYNRNDTEAGEHNRYNTDIFYCPIEWKKRLKEGFDVDTGGYDVPDWGFEYGINSKLADIGVKTDTEDTVQKAKFSSSDKWKDPARLPMFWDTSSTNDYSSGALFTQDIAMYPNQTLIQYGWDKKNAPRIMTINRFGPAANHGKGINYLFADGHVEMTLWPYTDTMQDPLPARDYDKYWHPLRNLDIPTHEK